MQAEHAEPGDGGLWLTITELADYLKVRKSTVSERVAALVADGKLMTRPGKGKSKLVHLATYLTVTNQVGDAAKEAAAKTRDLLAQEAPPAASAAPGAPTFRDAQTREKELAADLKQLELDERLGRLVAVADLAQVAEEAAEQIVALIERMPIRAEEMAASVAAAGVPGARAQYRRDARDLRAALAEPFKRLLSVSPAFADYEVAALSGNPPPVALWGDLDPAEHSPP